VKDYSDSEMINKLILDGGLEVASVDNDTGELLYSFTPKMKEIMPEIYQDHMHNVNSEIMNLWEKGFINMDLLQEDPLITLTLKALNKDEVKTLSKQERWSLFEVVRLLQRKV
jgi:hypothetical protein